MIEEGKTYKLKKIKGFDSNVDCDCEIIKIFNSQNPSLGKIALYKCNGEEYVAPVSEFIDPEDPKEYSDLVFKKLESVMKPMNLSFWKDLKEEATCASLGAAPCPGLAQVTSSGISAATVNGLPVPSKSVKKKKKKKNEDLSSLDLRPDLTRDELRDFELLKDKQDFLNDDTNSPAYGLKYADNPEVEFEDAINLLLFGQDEEDKEEYNEILDLIRQADRIEEYEKYALNKYNINDITSDNIGKQVDITVDDILDEIDEDFNEDYENITDLIAKYLDRLNFEYANTEDIIYKKEGDKKYLIKFDNELGILKFKVSEGDNTLIEKEYQIENEEDVEKVFTEIEDIYRKEGL